MAITMLLPGNLNDQSDGETTRVEFPCGCQFWFDSVPVDWRTEVGMSVCKTHGKDGVE